MKTLTAALLLFSAAAAKADCVPFASGPVSAGELVVEKGAVIVRVDIAGVGKALPLQLDTGASATELYGEAVPATVVAAGTTPRAVAITGWPAAAATIPVAVRPAEGKPGATAGTLGMDYLARGFVLDLAHRRLCTVTTIPRGDFTAWQPITRVNGSPVITAREGVNPIKLLLDTGSSGFTLLSTPALSATVATATPLRQLKVPSFGRMLTVGELQPTDVITVLGQPLRLETVYSLNDPDIEGMLKGAGINGLMGLRPFADGALAFDFPGGRLAFGQLPR